MGGGPAFGARLMHSASGNPQSAASAYAPGTAPGVAPEGRAAAKRVLVTGGLGYVGSWLTRRLALAGHEVFVLSRGSGQERGPGPVTGSSVAGSAAENPPGQISCPSLPDIGAPYVFIQGDLVEDAPRDVAERLPQGLDACVHAAAAVDGAAPGYARQSLLVNGLGTRNLLDALCLRAEMDAGGVSSASPIFPGAQAGAPGSSGETPPRLPLFLYCSTFHVYGPVSGHITEETPLAPVNDYALTHLFGEEYCRLFARAKGMPCTILRPSNGYGAPLFAPFRQWSLLINDVCRSAFTAGRIVLRANPAQERDFISLAEAARMVEGLISRPDLAGRTFNISSGQALSLGDVAGLAARVASQFLGRPVELDMRAPAHKDAVPLCVDSGAVRKALGLGPLPNAMAAMEHEMTAILEFLQTHEHP